MRERDLRVLEFPKILDKLAAYTVTDPGREKALALRPTGDAEVVRRRQAETEEASTVFAHSGGNPMLHFTDVSEQAHVAAIGGVLSMASLLEVATLLRAARTMRNALSQQEEETPVISAFGSRLYTDRALEEDIFNAILSEDEIADRASAELYDIRRKLRQINDRVRDKLNSLIRSTNAKTYLQDAIITMRNGRYVVPVRADARSMVPGIVHDQSASGSTLFVEPQAVVELGNDLKQWTLKEKQEIERILQEFSSRVAPDADGIRDDVEILAELDLIFARSALAKEMRAVPPLLNEEGRVNLIRARHPLIDPDKVVPSSLWLGGEFTALIITGPNTGGKTVTLKTMGLLAVMAQSGLQIPAAYGSELPIFDEVFADIGDEQSIEQSLSTFSSHMTHIVDIIQNVTPESLALFDELGAGTDPTEGAALAMSIISHLMRVKTRVMATTHYSELKAFALGTDGVENASVEFDVETLRPTYRLSIGVPGKSNAFEISRKLGLPDFLIEDAQTRLTGEQVKFEDVIANAEYNRKLAEKERELAEKAHIETQKLRNEAERLRHEIEEKREAELKKAKDEARQLLLKAKREAEQVIGELKQKKKTHDAKEHELHELRGRLDSAISENSDVVKQVTADDAPPKTLNVGDTVLLLSLNAKAVVLTKPDAKGDMTVQVGALKLKSNLSQVRLAPPDEKEKKKQKKSGSTSTSGVSMRAVETECDVRGMTLEEALTAVDLFLDGAVMNKLKLVSVIHGKGTGVLRSGVQQFLRRHSEVKEFRLGRYGEGEDGVTIVTLK